MQAARRSAARAAVPRPACRSGFILARRFTLCAFANFVDVLRLAADEGDRSRPILCEWTVLSDTHGPGRVELRGGGAAERAPAPIRARFDYIVVVGGLIDEIPNLSPDILALPAGCGRGARAARRRLHRRLHPAPRRADGRLPLLRELVPPRRFPGAVRRADAGVGPDLHRRPRPADLLGRRELGPSRGLSGREARRHRRRPERACRS